MTDAYDLKSVNLPKLTGRALQALAAVLESEIPGAILRKRFFADAGMLRARTTPMEEPPTFLPLVAGKPSPGKAPTLAEIEAPRRPTPFATVRDYARAFAAGEVTPLEVAAATLGAIDDSDARALPLKAYIALNRDDVMAQAAAATERYRRGQPLGPLDGVPVSVKDELDQVPYPTTGGTLFYGRRPAAQDSTVAARLRATGAVLVGKANMHEIGIDPSGLNVHYGQVRNPYDPRREPGGSSSGSAAAVAAGIVPVAIGADGGGSIRIPASLCGVVGLKPTFGRVSEAGAVPVCWSVAHVGPIGASVEDVALAYAVVAGADPRDPNSQRQPTPSVAGWSAGDLKGVRLGVYRAWLEHAAPDVVRANEAMIALLREAGAEVKDVVVPDLDLMRVAHVITILSEMQAFMTSFPQERRLLGDSVRMTLAITREMQSSDYIWAQRVRTRVLERFAKLFAEVDCLVTPGTAATAPLIPETAPGRAWSDLAATTEIMRYIVPGNLAGLPAICFPSGYDRDGLPIGTQAMASHWNEALLLRIAHVAEGRIERKPPVRFYRPLARAAETRG